MATILLAIENQQNRKLLADLIGSRFAVIETSLVVEEKTFDLCIVDQRSLRKSVEMLRRCRERESPLFLPVLLISSRFDLKSIQPNLLELFDEFLCTPIEKAELKARLNILLRNRELSETQSQYQQLLSQYNQKLKQNVEAKTQQLKDNYIETIYTLVRAAEFRDKDTGFHVERVSHFCRALAQSLGLDEKFCDQIFYASSMHDVGKIGVSDAILLKEGKLTAEEWEAIKSHPELGAKILEDNHSPYLQLGAEIALGHHERWEGGGYPYGLKGEAIPISCRIMSICDQYDALRSPRPYKPPFSHERTFHILTRGDDRTHPNHFDPEVLSAFVKCEAQFVEIYEAFSHPRTVLPANKNSS